MDKQEEIGFHKGALATLVKEREELLRLINIVNALIKAHMEGLEKLGVKPEEQPKNNASLENQI